MTLIPSICSVAINLHTDQRSSPERLRPTNSLGPLDRAYCPRDPPLLRPNLPQHLDAQGFLYDSRLGHSLDHLDSPSHHIPMLSH